MPLNVGQNYFELFGLPAGFELDSADLSSRYRELQRRFHPDKYAGASDQERRLSVQLTAHINEAFATLKDPVRRGRYLLGLKGVSTDEETDSVMDREFLMEQMAFREALEAARSSPQADQDMAALHRKLEQNFRNKTAELASLFREDSEPALRRARDLVREMQFLHKLAKEMDDDF